MVKMSTQGVWKSSIVDSGGQYVGTTGTKWTPLSCVWCWEHQVYRVARRFMERETDPSGWIMWCVMATKRALRIASFLGGGSMIVRTNMMLACHAAMVRDYMPKGVIGLFYPYEIEHYNIQCRESQFFDLHRLVHSQIMTFDVVGTRNTFPKV